MAARKETKAVRYRKASQVMETARDEVCKDDAGVWSAVLTAGESQPRYGDCKDEVCKDVAGVWSMKSIFFDAIIKWIERIVSVCERWRRL
jgi:hypothetical protein